MNPVIFVAPPLAALTALLVFGIVRVIAGWLGFNRNLPSLLFGVPIVTFGLSFQFYLYWIPVTNTHSGLNTTPQIANAHLYAFEIPENATAVDFRQTFYSCVPDEAEFNLSESDFLNWMAQESRTPVRFTDSKLGQDWNQNPKSYFHRSVDVIPVASTLASQSKIKYIKNGYYFDNKDSPDDDSVLTIVYDADASRVYIWQTSF